MTRPTAAPDLRALIERHLGPVEALAPVTYGRGWAFRDRDPAAARAILENVVPAGVDVEASRVTGRVLVLDHR